VSSHYPIPRRVAPRDPDANLWQEACTAGCEAARPFSEIKAEMNFNKAINVADIRWLAKRRLPRMAFDFIEGGCDDELGLRANEAAFESYQLLPRYFVDVSKFELGTRLIGQQFAFPIGIAPTGAAGIFRHDADRELARAGAAANVPFIMSANSNGSLEEAVAVAPEHTWFQLYGLKDSAITADKVRRAADAGIKALVLSVDVPVSANRERNRRNGFSLPLRLTPSIAFQALMHPAWMMEYLQNGGLPPMKNYSPYAPRGADAVAVGNLFANLFPAPALTWSLLDDVRRLWPRKLFVKGIMHPEDAVRAVSAGADGIMVSNHGARQLDRAPAPIDVLPAIRTAVGDRAEVTLDGGVRRGADIVTALCLGADAVFVGRPALYGAVVGGAAGVKKVLDILTVELRTVLGQIGCPRTEDLGPQFVIRPTAKDYPGFPRVPDPR
jgi:(S)-mandelate dehydrogenase